MNPPQGDASLPLSVCDASKNAPPKRDGYDHLAPVGTFGRCPAAATPDGTMAVEGLGAW